MFQFFKKRKHSQDLFNSWLMKMISLQIPDGIIAFNIGLLESNKGFAAYFMGSKTYDEHNSDWACDFGDYLPKEPYLYFNNTELENTNAEKFQTIIYQYFNNFKNTSEFKNSFLNKAK